MDWEFLLQAVERQRDEVQAAHQRCMRHLERGGRVEIALLCRLSNANVLLASLGGVAKSALKEERIQTVEDNHANATT